MKKFLTIGLFIFAVAISYNCRKALVTPDPGKVKISLPETPFDYSTLTTPTGTTFVRYENLDMVNSLKATIGRVLFYDKALSLNNSVSCASCHMQKNAFSDVTSLSKGFEEKRTIRNSMGINNLLDERNIGYFWDAREKKIENMVFAPIANHIEMGFERIDLITEKVSNLPYYKKLFNDCYGSEEITEQKMRESLGNFLFAIVSGNSKFDEGSLNNFADFTASEIRGKKLFTEKKCNTCHFFSNTVPSSYGSSGLKFANIGLDVKDVDGGINGQYKIPRLRNISLTAPYMHDGRFKSLEEVLEHYSHNIKDNPALSFVLKDANAPAKLNFTDQEKADLIAFLNTLNDQVMTSDEKFSSPFID